MWVSGWLSSCNFIQCDHNLSGLYYLHHDINSFEGFIKRIIMNALFLFLKLMYLVCVTSLKFSKVNVPLISILVFSLLFIIFFLLFWFPFLHEPKIAKLNPFLKLVLFSSRVFSLGTPQDFPDAVLEKLVLDTTSNPILDGERSGLMSREQNGGLGQIASPVGGGRRDIVIRHAYSLWSLQFVFQMMLLIIWLYCC